MIFDQEIEEIHKLRKQFNQGHITPDRFMMNLRAFDQTHKCMSNKIQAYAVALKANRGIKRFMERDGLIGMGSMVQIDNGAYEVEMIPCIGMNNAIIARRDCLDYSGSNTYPECLCETGRVTKNLLLPERNG
jgi:hypothetical protein